MVGWRDSQLDGQSGKLITKTGTGGVQLPLQLPLPLQVRPYRVSLAAHSMAN